MSKCAQRTSLAVSRDHCCRVASAHQRLLLKPTLSSLPALSMISTQRKYFLTQTTQAMQKKYASKYAVNEKSRLGVRTQ